MLAAQVNDGTGAGAAVRGRRPDLALMRFAFAALMLFWLSYPLFVADRVPQDAVPLVAAGALVRNDPAAIYIGPGGGLFRVKPPFFAESCRYYDGPEECERYVVAFVSPPPAIAVAEPLSALGADAFGWLRGLGAASLVGAMVLLWRRLVSVSSRAAGPMALAALLLTPLMTTPIGLGQTSPLLFLAASVPVTVAVADKRMTALFSAMMGLAIAFKAFPAALLAVPVLHRRWRAVIGPAAVVAGLATASLVLAPARLWSDFIESSGPLSQEALGNPYSSSIESALGQLDIRSGAFAWALRLALLVPLAVLLRRLKDVDLRWACGWAALLVVFPQVWGHYSFVLVSAVVAVLVARADRDRFLWALPAVAALTVPIGVVGGTGNGSPVLQLTCNAVALSVALFVARRPAPAPVM
ncbi:MAG: glycosyltransferase family 87 protein [Acidimicrobiia bacterium]